MSDKRCAYTTTTILGCHGNHGQIAIGQTVRDGAGEADDLTARCYGDTSALAGSKQRFELSDGSEPMRPAARA